NPLCPILIVKIRPTSPLLGVIEMDGVKLDVDVSVVSTVPVSGCALFYCFLQLGNTNNAIKKATTIKKESLVFIIDIFKILINNICLEIRNSHQFSYPFAILFICLMIQNVPNMAVIYQEYLKVGF